MGKIQQRSRLDRQAWIEAARNVLIESGINHVRAERLAAVLGVTTGSFYWHFKNIGDLQAALAEDWEITNSAALFKAVADAGDDPNDKWNALVDVWIDEIDYSPAYDSAMRDWAREAPGIEMLVRKVDDARIEMLRKIFLSLGHRGTDAFIRARVTYFHQVGYYAMRILESKARRKQLKPFYRDALMSPVRKPGAIS